MPGRRSSRAPWPLDVYQRACVQSISLIHWPGFSLHAGVSSQGTQERWKLERLCRYISRPAVLEKRLSLAPNRKLRYRLKTAYRDGTTHVVFEPFDFVARGLAGADCGEKRAFMVLILMIDIRSTLNFCVAETLVRAPYRLRRSVTKWPFAPFPSA